MNARPTRAAALIGAAAVLSLSIAALAQIGSLTPPAGPIADTDPSLADLDPSGAASTLGPLSPPAGSPTDTSPSLAELQSAIAALQAQLDAQLSLEDVYPVGSVYISTSFDLPASLNFGTWERFSEGRVLVGVGNNTVISESGEMQSRTFTPFDMGGEYAHTLTVSEMPAHRHGPDGGTAFAVSGSGSLRSSAIGTGPGAIPTTQFTDTQGGDQAHNTMQPYIAVSIWRRTN